MKYTDIDIIVQEVSRATVYGDGTFEPLRGLEREDFNKGKKKKVEKGYIVNYLIEHCLEMGGEIDELEYEKAILLLRDKVDMIPERKG